MQKETEPRLCFTFPYLQALWLYWKCEWRVVEEQRHDTRPLRFWLLAGYPVSTQTFKLVSGSTWVAFSRDLDSFDRGRVSTDACFTGVATSLCKLPPANMWAFFIQNNVEAINDSWYIEADKEDSLWNLMFINDKKVQVFVSCL